MVRWGNKRANDFWQANLPRDFRIPNENDPVTAVERWIRDKYEVRRFASRTVPAWVDSDVDLSLPLPALLAIAGAGAGGGDDDDGAAAGSGAGAEGASWRKHAAPPCAPVCLTRTRAPAMTDISTYEISSNARRQRRV